MTALQQTGESSDNMIMLFFVYFMSVHAVLLSVACWAWRVRSDYEKLISLTVRCAASETSRELRDVAELLNEYGRDALRDALSKWNEPVSGIKADIVSRLINSKQGIVRERQSERQ